jgi:hypothetical protein
MPSDTLLKIQREEYLQQQALTKFAEERVKEELEVVQGIVDDDIRGAQSI